MCLKSIDYYQSKEEIDSAMENPLVANEDIIVYKILCDVDLSFLNETGRSPFKKFLYKKGQMYKSKLITEIRLALTPNNKYFFEVENGLHAYVKHDSKSSIWLMNKYCAKIKMIIPKGSKYYLGTDDEIVSDTLYWPSYLYNLKYFLNKFLKLNINAYNCKII